MKIKSLEDYVYSKHGVYGKGHEFECSALEYERLKSLNFKMEVIEEEELDGDVVPPPDPNSLKKEENETENEDKTDKNPPQVNENLLSFNEIMSKLGLNPKTLGDLIKSNNIEKVDGKYDVRLIEKALEAGKTGEEVVPSEAPSEETKTE